MDMFKILRPFFWLYAMTLCVNVGTSDVTESPADAFETSTAQPSNTTQNWANRETTILTPQSVCQGWVEKWHQPTADCDVTGPVLVSVLAFLKEGYKSETCIDPTNVRQAAIDLHCTFQSRHSTCVTVSNENEQSDSADRAKTDIKSQHRLPSPSASDEVIRTLCMVNTSMNWPCLTSRLDAIQLCVRTEVQSYIDLAGGMNTFRDIEVCRYQSMLTLCALESLEETCGSATSSPMVAILGHHLAPSHCATYEFSGSGRLKLYHVSLMLWSLCLVHLGHRMFHGTWIL